MLEADIKKLMRSAKLYAISRGLGSLADDFVQEVFLAYAKGWKQSFEHTLADFLRKEYGEMRTEKGKAQIVSRLRTSQLDAPRYENDSSMTFGETIADMLTKDPEQILEEKQSEFSYEKNLNFRTANQSEVYGLKKQDFTNKDIAEIYRVHPSRISQIIKEITGHVSRAICLDEIWDEYWLDDNRSKLQINWIEI